MNTFNTLRIVMALRGFVTVALSFFGGEEPKAPPHAQEPVKVTVTRVENDGRLLIETRRQMADGSETKSLEVVPILVK